MATRHEAVRISDDEVIVRYGDIEICHLTSRPPRREGDHRLWLLDGRFPLKAERIYRQGAADGGMPQEETELRCFLARLYYLLCGPTRGLRPSVFSDRPGRSGEISTLGKLTRRYPTPLTSLVGLWAEDRDAVSYAVDDQRPFWREEYIALLRETDPWLAAGPGPGCQPGGREVELATQLLELERQLTAELYEPFSGRYEGGQGPNDPEIEHAVASELRGQLVDRITAYRSSGTAKWEGLEQALPRLVWFGRDAFLLMYSLGADGIYRTVLRDQMDWSEEERRGFVFMHTRDWNGSLLIPRVDPYLREFLFFDEQERVPLIRRLAFEEIASAERLDRVTPLNVLWYIYVRTWRLHMAAEPGDVSCPDGVVSLEPEDGETQRDGAEVTEVTRRQYEEHLHEEHAATRRAGFRESIQRIMASLSDRNRKIVQLVYQADQTQAEAAERMGVHPSTVSRAVSRFLQTAKAELGVTGDA